MSLVCFLFFLLLPFSATAHETIKAVVSFSILADLVKNVGNDRVSVTTLVGPNADIHAYEPTPNDIKILKDARIIFINGLNLDNFIYRLIIASETKALLAEISTDISPLTMKNQGYGTRHRRSVDPHAWQSIPNVEIYVNNIAASLCYLDPQACEDYNANARAYIQKLHATHEALVTQIATIPKDKRVIITSHNAFGYFADEYGFTVLAPENISKETEAAAADVVRLIEQIKNNKVFALFIENISNPRLIKQIERETGLRIGGTLYSDALSGKNGPAETYLDMITHNVNTIVTAITKHQGTQNSERK